MYTPPTPTRRNKTVSSRRRRLCVLGIILMFTAYKPHSVSAGCTVNTSPTGGQEGSPSDGRAVTRYHGTFLSAGLEWKWQNTTYLLAKDAARLTEESWRLIHIANDGYSGEGVMPQYRVKVAVVGVPLDPFHHWRYSRHQVTLSRRRLGLTCSGVERGCVTIVKADWQNHRLHSEFK